MDLQELAVEQGYWCGYYVNSDNKTKLPEVIIKKMQEARSPSQPSEIAEKDIKIEEGFEKLRQRDARIKALKQQ